MNIFPLRRRDAALSELKVPDAMFVPVDEPDPELSTMGDLAVLPDDPAEPTAVSAANELVTTLVELDIIEAIRAETTPPEPPQVPAPLSQRHLETIDRLVTHLKADEQRLRRQIADARKQLADTQLARRGFERNSAYLRRGVAVFLAHPETPRRPRLTPPDPEILPDPAAKVH